MTSNQSERERVAILGASNKPERYSNKALHMLRKHGHDPVPVHPSLEEIDGHPVLPTLDAVTGEIHTLTVYVNPSISSELADDILALKPGRVIFNPGSENPELAARLTAANIPIEEACTLVLLNTGQF